MDQEVYEANITTRDGDMQHVVYLPNHTEICKHLLPVSACQECRKKRRYTHYVKEYWHQPQVYKSEEEYD